MLDIKVTRLLFKRETNGNYLTEVYGHGNTKLSDEKS